MKGERYLDPGAGMTYCKDHFLWHRFGEKCLECKTKRKEHQRLRRPCSRCDKMFEPAGPTCKICDKCLQISRKKGTEKTRAWNQRRRDERLLQ